MKDYYTVAEIAQMFDYADSNVYRIIKKGDLDAVKVGGRYLIPKDSLKAFISKRTQAGA